MDSLYDMTGSVRRVRDAIGRIQSSARTTLEAAIEAGVGLIEQKEHVPHGGWGEWIAEQYGVNSRTAQHWMRLGRHKDRLNCETVSLLGVREALEIIAEGDEDGSDTDTEQCVRRREPDHDGGERVNGLVLGEQLDDLGRGGTKRLDSPGSATDQPVRVVRDELGEPVPEAIADIFRRRGEMTRYMAAIARLKGEAPDDPLLIAAVDTKDHDNLPRQWRRTWQHGLPHCVCPHWPQCEDGCGLCRDRGWLTKAQYDRLPEEQRNLCSDRSSPNSASGM